MPSELPEQCCGGHHGGHKHHNQLAQLHYGVARYKAYAWVQALKFENAVPEEEGRPSRSTHTHTHTHKHTHMHAHTHTHM